MDELESSTREKRYTMRVEHESLAIPLFAKVYAESELEAIRIFIKILSETGNANGVHERQTMIACMEFM